MASDQTEPTQKTLDALFAKSIVARIRYPVGGYLDAPRQPTLVELKEKRFAQLHAALGLIDDGVPISCHCTGTVSVELVDSSQPIAVLILHLHRHMHSLWLAGSSSGARLRDGYGILQGLAHWGISAPLEVFAEANEQATYRGPTEAEIAEMERSVQELTAKFRQHVERRRKP